MMKAEDLQKWLYKWVLGMKKLFFCEILKYLEPLLRNQDCTHDEKRKFVYYSTQNIFFSSTLLRT